MPEGWPCFCLGSKLCSAQGRCQERAAAGSVRLGEIAGVFAAGSSSLLTAASSSVGLVDGLDQIDLSFVWLILSSAFKMGLLHKQGRHYVLRKGGNGKSHRYNYLRCVSVTSQLTRFSFVLSVIIIIIVRTNNTPSYDWVNTDQQGILKGNLLFVMPEYYLLSCSFFLSCLNIAGQLHFCLWRYREESRLWEDSKYIN
jgi:hypothetical protein